MPVITLIISITNVSIIWYGGHNVAQGTLEVGNMMAFMTYAMQILMSFMMMTMIFVLVPRAQASAVRINEVLDMNKEKELTNDQQIKKKYQLLILMISALDIKVLKNQPF